MERAVFLITGNDEYYLGTVKELLSSGRQHALVQVVQGLVEGVAFSDDSSDYAVFSIEVR